MKFEHAKLLEELKLEQTILPAERGPFMTHKSKAKDQRNNQRSRF